MKVLRTWPTHIRNYGLLSLAAVLLTLLSLGWMGYDFRQFAVSLIGAHVDRYFNAWAIWQAITNLMTRPFDAGHAAIFSADPAPFALTNAPYGIAIILIPLYWLSGSNLIITYNLTLIATFPLTAMSVYLLLRYVIQPPRFAAGLLALMVAFAPFRFWHLEQVEILSMHLFFFSLYSFHRLLDDSRWSWAAVLGGSVWLLALTSGYLAVCFAIAAALLSAIGLLFYTDAFLSRLRYLIPTGLITGLLLWPMAAWRWANPAFRAGYNADTIAYFSAQPGDWLVGYSQLYTDQPLHLGSDTPLFVGFALLIAAGAGLLAVIRWRDTGNDEVSAARMLSPRTTLVTYAVLAGLGLVLTLGPSIMVGEGRTVWLPYRLVTGWPIFSGLRLTGRYILLTITGLTVLAAYGFKTWLPRLSRRWQVVVMVSLIVGATVEQTPYNGVTSGSDSARRLEHAPIRERPELAAWLDVLPANTQFVVYPVKAISEALFDPVTRGRALVNGHGSFLPEWYAVGLTGEDMSRYLIGNYAARGADYLLFYSGQDASGTPDPDALLSIYRREWDDLRLIGQFDDVLVYAIEMDSVSAARYDFDGTAPGRGWYDSLVDVSGNGFQWMSESSATLDYSFVDESAVRLTARIVKAASPEIFESLVLRVNGEPVTMRFEEDADGSRVYEADIPASLLGGEAEMTRFSFEVRGVVHEGLADPDQGTYPYGLLFDWVSIEPVEE